MGATTRRRWERVLLALAVLFGVVAMHAMVAPMHDQVMPPAAAAASIDGQLVASIAMATTVTLPHVVGHEVPVATASSDVPTDGPMSMPHTLMHLCLAILSAGIVLGLLAVAILLLLGHELIPSQTPVLVGTRPSRPPRRSALRLSELCVLRN